MVINNVSKKTSTIIMCPEYINFHSVHVKGKWKLLCFRTRKENLKKKKEKKIVPSKDKLKADYIRERMDCPRNERAEAI